MDFAPSRSTLSNLVAKTTKLSKEQEVMLRKAFDLAVLDENGGISKSELKEILKAMDEDFEDDGSLDQLVNALFQRTDKETPETVTFKEVKSMLEQRLHYRIQEGRYYVALCLAEAECMRAALHAKAGSMFCENKDTVVGLRTGNTLLDASLGYVPAEPYQDKAAAACYKFIDSSVQYDQQELSLLLRSLQDNDIDKRRKFFIEVRSNRRRKQQDPSTSSLSKVFVTADEYSLLQYRVTIARIRTSLREKGLYSRDAFAAFDYDNDGLLNYAELYGGLEWLGLKMSPVLVRELLNKLDKDARGLVTLDAFKNAIGADEELTGDTSSLSIETPIVLPKPPEDDGDGSGVVVIPPSILSHIKVKVKSVTNFSQVWNSRGSMSRSKVSVWEPVLGGNTFRQNKAYVSIGHYARIGYENPNRDSNERLALEVTDASGNFASSHWLSHVLKQYLPHPARFRLSWSITHGSNKFYAWEPIPPSNMFVTLGMVGTTTEEQPNVSCVRCLPRTWVQESNSAVVHQIWNNSGASGNHGAIWNISNMNTVGIFEGHSRPRKQMYSLKKRRFFISDFNPAKLGEKEKKRG
mmetsp:Transcript_24616/g.56402  ORF Transcript_24616/g.56402 Transcript_24616/m.56402 type:complete len:579 (-) Transcript_24616:110-1846(-)